MPFELKTVNRFIIDTEPYKIPEYLLHQYELVHENGHGIFTFYSYEHAGFTINPKKLLKIKRIKISFLGAEGNIIDYLILNVKITDYKTQGNYSDVIASKYTVIAEILKMTTKQEVNARKYKALLTKKIQIEETNI